MKDKVYIVTSGDYSDYSITAVFEHKKAAEAYVKVHNIKEHVYRDPYKIEEYPLNTPRDTITVVLSFNKSLDFQGCMEPWLNPIRTKDTIYKNSHRYYVQHTYPVGTSKKKILKIAADLLIQAVSEDTIEDE